MSINLIYILIFSTFYTALALKVERIRTLAEPDAQSIACLISDAFDVKSVFRVRKLSVYNHSIQVRHRLDNLSPHGLFVARDNTDGIKGFVEVGLARVGASEEPQPLIGNLVVAPDARRGGVGSRLVTAAEELVSAWPRCSASSEQGGAIARRFRSVYVAVEDDNTAAFALYTNVLGYRTVRREPSKMGWRLESRARTILTKDLISSEGDPWMEG